MYLLNEQETKYQQTLAAANNFMLEDLEANRGGRITEGQLARLKRSLYSSLGCSVLLILIGAGLLVGGIAAALGGSDGLIAGIIMLVIGLVLVPLGLFSVRRGYGDVKAPRLLSYEGIVLKQVEKKNLHGGSALGGCIVGLIAALAGVDKNYYYKCDNGERFKVSKAAYDVLVESETYDVYYARGGIMKGVLFGIGLIPVEVTRKRRPGATAAAKGTGKAVAEGGDR